MRRVRGRGAERPGGAARWALAGAAAGLVAGLVAFAPAAWLAAAAAAATNQHLLLADARGSVWSGSAVAVLSGGEGSHDARALPGRLHWTLGLDGTALALNARQDCCITGTLRLRVQPGLGRLTIALPASTHALVRWPADWLAGLGTPFNTLQLGGWLALSSGGLQAASSTGRWQLQGSAMLALDDLSSRLSPLPVLGSYRVALAGGTPPRVTLSTVAGPLLLSGSGQWTPTGLRFRGDASAAAGFEAALNNLLNILGRRQGTQAVLSIG